MTFPSEPRARATDPETSHEAAASVKDLTLVQSRIMALIGRQGPMHDDALIFRWGQENYRFPDSYPRVSEAGLRSRRSELVKLGRLQDSGLRVTLASGRKSIVWRRVP